MGQCGAHNREIGVIQEWRGRGGTDEGKEEREPTRRERWEGGRPGQRWSNMAYCLISLLPFFFTSCQLGHQAIKTARMFPSHWLISLFNNSRFISRIRLFSEQHTQHHNAGGWGWASSATHSVIKLLQLAKEKSISQTDCCHHSKHINGGSRSEEGALPCKRL